MLFNISAQKTCGDKYNYTSTDAQCTSAFISYMAKKCSLWGMIGTTFANPSGLTQDSVTTPRDLLKLGVAVAANPVALGIWSTPDGNFSVKGAHARTLAVTNNLMAEGAVGPTVNAGGYKFLGGKGGSYWSGSSYWRAGVDIVDIEGRSVVLALLAKGQTSFNNLHLSTKELCDMIKATLNGQTPSAGTNISALVTNGGGYASCVAPDVPGAYLDFITPAELAARTYSVSAAQTISSLPASTSKTMTMLCALDFARYLYDTITVKSGDISSGSGSTFYDGDELLLLDALRIMMAESSNTLANTVARSIGRVILAYA